ncbi:hypothetical protein CR513_04635, partial [Mucuna pruriens]
MWCPSWRSTTPMPTLKASHSNSKDFAKLGKARKKAYMSLSFKQRGFMCQIDVVFYTSQGWQSMGYIFRKDIMELFKELMYTYRQDITRKSKHFFSVFLSVSLSPCGIPTLVHPVSSTRTSLDIPIEIWRRPPQALEGILCGLLHNETIGDIGRIHQDKGISILLGWSSKRLVVSTASSIQYLGRYEAYVLGEVLFGIQNRDHQEGNLWDQATS